MLVCQSFRMLVSHLAPLSFQCSTDFLYTVVTHEPGQGAKKTVAATVIQKMATAESPKVSASKDNPQTNSGTQLKHTTDST